MSKLYTTELTDFLEIPACTVCNWAFSASPEVYQWEYENCAYSIWDEALYLNKSLCLCGRAICPECGEKVGLYIGRYELTYKIITRKKLFSKDEVIPCRVGERFIRGTLREIQKREKIQTALEIQSVKHTDADSAEG